MSVIQIHFFGCYYHIGYTNIIANCVLNAFSLFKTILKQHLHIFNNSMVLIDCLFINFHFNLVEYDISRDSHNLKIDPFRFDNIELIKIKISYNYSPFFQKFRI